MSACIKKKPIKIGEFLCSHFNIEDERKCTTFFGIICFVISRKVKRQPKRKKRKDLCISYGEGAVTIRTRQKWFAKFHAGDFLPDDAPWSGRADEVNSD